LTVGENDLIFAKVKPDAIIPSKREEDAGMDVYACFQEDYIIIPAHHTKMIPTGIASALNPKYYIQIEERGSTGSKGIKKSAGIIDSGFRSEWFIIISNVTNEVE
jgi:dUTP pyrophosphatase